MLLLPCIPSVMFPGENNITEDHNRSPVFIYLSGVMYMGYRIEYPGTPVRWNPGRLRWKRIFFYAGFCFGLLIVGVSVFWKEGREVLIQWFYPGDPVITRQALIHMAGRLRAGEAFEEAALVFCREILGGV